MEQLVKKALSGDKKSLESLLVSVQDYVYNIAVRFLWDPEDAKDATQEVLIKICTHLSSFKSESKFTTWAYRIATNHLINFRKSSMESRNIDFTSFSADLQQNFDPIGYEDADKYLLEEEVKIGCTTGMLLCLTRELRIAYILGDILEVKSVEAADLLDITADLFRKRLQHARALVRNFMQDNCGVADARNRCRCNNMISCGLKRGIVRKENLLFATDSNVISSRDEIQSIHNAADIFRNHPQYKTPGKVLSAIRTMLDSGQFRVLQ
jgi:RNA polymerase sigma factor (sigma-70 family)